MTDFTIKQGRAIRNYPHAKPFEKIHIPLAKEFKKWFNENNGKFQAPFEKALAISHSQCEKDSVKMFVVDKDMVGRYAKDEHGKRNRENFFFPDQLILNAEIITMMPTTLRDVNQKTGFLGLSKKTKKVAQDNVYVVDDACMSFPFEKNGAMVERVNVITVKYQTIGLLGNLVDHEETIHGMKSHIFQHEWDHQRSKDIHMGAKQNRWVENGKRLTIKR